MKFLRTLFGLVKLWRSDEPDYVEAPEGSDYMLPYSLYDSWLKRKIATDGLMLKYDSYISAINRIYELEEELERLKR